MKKLDLLTTGSYVLILIIGMALGWGFHSRISQTDVENKTSSIGEVDKSETVEDGVQTTETFNEVFESDTDLVTTDDSMTTENDTDQQSVSTDDSKQEIAPLTADMIRSMYGLEQEYSRVAISPNGTKAAYIDNVGFEVVGNVFLYDADSAMTTALTQFTYADQQTVKKILWIDENTLVLIIGFSTGTVSQGGDIYVYHVSSSALKPVLIAKERTEYVDFSLAGEQLQVKEVKWLDENLIDYIYEDLFFSLSDFMDVK